MSAENRTDGPGARVTLRLPAIPEPAPAGFDAHLTKPVDMECLLGLLTN